MELVEIGKNILTSCMNVRPKEQVLVVTDDEKYAIGQALYQAAKVLGSEAMLMTMSPRAVSGQEPPAAVAARHEGCRCGPLPYEYIHYPHPGQNRGCGGRERGWPRCQVSQKICLPRVL